jgi:hypothetical protein
MGKIFKLDANLHYFPEVEYRYERLDATVFAMQEIPHNYRSTYEMTTGEKRILEPHNDLVIAWSDFAKSAFTDYAYESDMPCWEGHYEQFGVTMVNMIYLHESSGDTFLKRIYPAEEDIGDLYRVELDTTNRMFYRCWYGLLGHPHFLRERIVGEESVLYNLASLSLSVSWANFVENVGRDRAYEQVAT